MVAQLSPERRRGARAGRGEGSSPKRIPAAKPRRGDARADLHPGARGLATSRRPRSRRRSPGRRDEVLTRRARLGRSAAGQPSGCCAGAAVGAGRRRSCSRNGARSGSRCSRRRWTTATVTWSSFRPVGRGARWRAASWRGLNPLASTLACRSASNFRSGEFDLADEDLNAGGEAPAEGIASRARRAAAFGAARPRVARSRRRRAACPPGRSSRRWRRWRRRSSRRSRCPCESVDERRAPLGRLQAVYRARAWARTPRWATSGAPTRRSA